MVFNHEEDRSHFRNTDDVTQNETETRTSNRLIRSHKYNKLSQKYTFHNTRGKLRNSFKINTDKPGHINTNSQELQSSERMQFEKFREYIESKRQDANVHLEKLRGNSSRRDRGSLIERTKKSYESYRQYISDRLPEQAQRTRATVLQRQQEEVLEKRSKRQSQQQHEAQRGNLLLVVLVCALLVIVAISIGQLVG